MAFNNDAWEFSNVTTEEVKSNFARPVEGDRYLKIMDAYYDKDSTQYSITVVDLGNEANFTLSYWLCSVDQETGEPIPNVYHRNTLVTLGRALSGQEIGIPNPENIKGGVVMAHITLKPSKKDPTKKYARCSTFDAVPYDMAVIADIDQYSIDGPAEE